MEDTQGLKLNEMGEEEGLLQRLLEQLARFAYGLQIDNNTVD